MRSKLFLAAAIGIAIVSSGCGEASKDNASPSASASQSPSASASPSPSASGLSLEEAEQFEQSDLSANLTSPINAVRSLLTYLGETENVETDKLLAWVKKSDQDPSYFNRELNQKSGGHTTIRYDHRRVQILDSPKKFQDSTDFHVQVSVGDWKICTKANGCTTRDLETRFTLWLEGGQYRLSDSSIVGIIDQD